MDKFNNNGEINYSRLTDLLADGKWKEADIETMAVLLQAAGKEKKLTVEEIEKISLADLETIDRLWIKYSNGRFGFSVQKRIWQSVGGIINAERDADYQTWHDFGEKVGWRIKGSWLFWDELNFVTNALVGHLPALNNGRWSRSWWGLNYHLITRRIKVGETGGTTEYIPKL